MNTFCLGIIDIGNMGSLYCRLILSGLTIFIIHHSE